MVGARRFLRTIRFDGTDAFVFDRAANADEWAVSGAFAFVRVTRDEIKGKTRQAFANGFLGLTSFGRSTFTCVADIDDDALADATERLAHHCVADHGAPSRRQALPVAREEVAFVCDLVADVPVNTIFALTRSFDDTGQIHEQFRRIEQRLDGGPIYAKAWELDDGRG